MQKEKGSEEKKEGDEGLRIEGAAKIGSEKGLETYRRKMMLPRDYKFLKFCFEQYFMRRSQIIDWLIQNYELKNESSAKTVMIRILQLLRGRNLIKPFRAIQFEFEEAFFVTTKGICLLGSLIPKKSAYTPIDEPKLKHDELVTAVRMAWERTLPIAHWIPERVLRNGRKREVPDAVAMVCLNPEDKFVNIAIEIESTRKSRKRYVHKAWDYKSSKYEFVFYFVASDEISEVVFEACRGITDKIHICSLSEFLKVGGEATITSLNDAFVIKNRFTGKMLQRKSESYCDDWIFDSVEWGCD